MIKKLLIRLIKMVDPDVQVGPKKKRMGRPVGSKDNEPRVRRTRNQMSKV